MAKCIHHWNYEHRVYYDSTHKTEKIAIRRWCHRCGVIQHSYITGRWYKSEVGPTKMWGMYPEGYPEDTKE